MTNRALTILFTIAITLGGCARPADISKPKHFDDGEVVFDYPGNWKVTKNEVLPSGRLIFVEESGDALVVLTVYGPGFDADLEQYSASFTKNLGAAVPFNLLKNNGASAKGDRIDCKYAFRLGTVDVPHTANITRHVFGECQVICVTQVADEDRHFVDSGFDLIRRTLASNPAKMPNKASEPTAPSGRSSP